MKKGLASLLLGAIVITGCEKQAPKETTRQTAEQTTRQPAEQTTRQTAEQTTRQTDIERIMVNQSLEPKMKLPTQQSCGVSKEL
jgi:PBP1b-binding outer membrane lipoprotein LpoB